MTTLKTLKRELLNDAKTRAAYDTLADEYAIARELIAARARAGLSQSEVAQRMGTTQSVVARLESGKRPPAMRTVERFAQAVGGHVVFRIEALA
jgi:ribosome-binding protein aMBF1 (putative translation factor)